MCLHFKTLIADPNAGNLNDHRQISNYVVDFETLHYGIFSISLSHKSLTFELGGPAEKLTSFIFVNKLLVI